MLAADPPVLNFLQQARNKGVKTKNGYLPMPAADAQGSNLSMPAADAQGNIISSARLLINACCRRAKAALKRNLSTPAAQGSIQRNLASIAEDQVNLLKDKSRLMRLYA